MPRRSKTPFRKRRSQDEDDRLEESFINTLNTSLNMLQSKNGTELEEYQAKQNKSNYNEKNFLLVLHIISGCGLYAYSSGYYFVLYFLKAIEGS